MFLAVSSKNDRGRPKDDAGQTRRKLAQAYELIATHPRVTVLRSVSCSQGHGLELFPSSWKRLFGIGCLNRWVAKGSDPLVQLVIHKDFKLQSPHDTSLNKQSLRGGTKYHKVPSVKLIFFLKDFEGNHLTFLRLASCGKKRRKSWLQS